MEKTINHNNKTAIIILNYNSWKETLIEIQQCVEVLNHNYQDIIVIDNCSKNESGVELKKASKNLGFYFIQSNENKGYAFGNNIGLRYAFKKGYNSALILNNDIIFTDNQLLSKMNSYLQKDPSLAIISPDIFSPSGYMFNRDSKRPTFFDFTLGMLNYRIRGRKIKDIGGYGYTYRPQGCCMLVKLEILNKVGYLDENTFLYCEEIIVAEKLLSQNYKCACCIDCRVIHDHSYTVNSVFKKKNIIKMKNKSFVYYLVNYRKFGFLKTFLCCLFNTLKLLLLK